MRLNEIGRRLRVRCGRHSDTVSIVHIPLDCQCAIALHPVLSSQPMYVNDQREMLIYFRSRGHSDTLAQDHFPFSCHSLPTIDLQAILSRQLIHVKNAKY